MHAESGVVIKLEYSGLTGVATRRAVNTTIALTIVSLRNSHSRMASAVIAEVGFAGRQTKPVAPCLVDLMVAIGLRSVVYVITVAHQTVLG